MVTAVNVNDAYTDLSSLNAIKQTGREDSAAGLKQVAQQFEALFLNMMLKTMRDSNKVFAEGNILQSNEMEFYQQNFDNQISLHLAQGKGLGLAEVLHKQLLQQYRVRTGERQQQDLAHAPRQNKGFDSPADFVKQLYPAARKAASKLGVKAEVLLAQSALETGWGASIARDGQGDSNNLFGIKADRSWSGPVTWNRTLEYSEGAARREHARFRRYESYQASFDDYVKFLQANPRYQKALHAAADSEQYVNELQAAGYATDPDYGRRINGVLNSAAMRTALGQHATAAGGD